MQGGSEVESGFVVGLFGAFGRICCDTYILFVCFGLFDFEIVVNDQGIWVPCWKLGVVME